MNVAFSFKWTSRFPVPKSMCLRWYVLHTSAFIMQYVASHVTLLRRGTPSSHRSIAQTHLLSRIVLDLNKGRDVAFTFIAFHLAELVGVFFSSKGTVSAMEFDSTCHALSVRKDAFLFLCVHTFLFLLFMADALLTDLFFVIAGCLCLSKL